MIIANPLYDVIFKYLLEDLDIVREFLSVILGEQVISADPKPQEILAEGVQQDVSIYRFDFKAIVKTASGEHKNILIELQKAKQALDVMRFRKYLGENYQREDALIEEDGSQKTAPLPIVTVYILGFRLDAIPQPIVKINREYRDAVTGETLLVKEDFAELLTHDSYFIQVPRLRREVRTKLESVLQVFSQEYRMEDPRRLDFRGNADDPLVKKMLDRLERAYASEKMRKIMDIEDELAKKFGQNARRLEQETARANEAVARADEAAARAADEAARADQEKAEKEAALAKANAEKQRADDLQRRLDDLEKRLNG